MAQLDIIHTQEENSVVLAITGRIDTTTSAQFETDAFDVLTSPVDLILDFTNVAYVSSAGLRVLLKLQKKQTAENTKLVVRNVSPEVMEVFEVTGFTDILTIQ